MKQWKSLQIEHLVFNDTEHHQQINLGPLNISIKRGEKIALIGKSGAGKTTFMNLLSGLHHAACTHLEIDNMSFKSLHPLHLITTLVPQEPELFDNTILFNMTFGLESDLHEIEELIEITQLKEFINSLPYGLGTDLREHGSSLSVGQKQRLALARGLFAARFSSLILLDEPTSSLDLATENKLLNKMLDKINHAAVIVSLHRLHTLPQFDRIIMLDRGVIIADGSPAVLLNEPGPVYDLWKTGLWHKEN